MTKDAGSTLHLFSSDYRPLYVQDCLDLLSKPRGAVQRFRYRRELVSTSAGPAIDVRQAWLDLEKRHIEVLVYFVAIREPTPGESVYVPLRRGKVVKTFVEGEFFFVDFSVDDFIDPFGYGADKQVDRPDLASSGSRLAYLKDLSRGVRNLLGDRFPRGVYPDGLEGRFSAIVGPHPLRDGRAHGSSDESAAFTHAARALSDLLVPRAPATVGVAPVEVVAPPTADTFIRIVDLRRLRRSGKAAWIRPRMGKRQIKLRGGSQYALEVFQFSSKSGFVEISADLPTTVIPITTNKVTLSTPYDVATFEFFAEARDNPTQGEIRLRVKRDGNAAEIDPALSSLDTAVLPDARFAVRIVPRRSLIWLSWLVAIGTTVAAFVVTLASLDGVFLSPPEEQTDVIDFTGLVQWTGLSGAYLGVDASALIVAAIAGIGTGIAALAALLRRRFGLTS